MKMLSRDIFVVFLGEIDVGFFVFTLRYVLSIFSNVDQISLSTLALLWKGFLLKKNVGICSGLAANY